MASFSVVSKDSYSISVEVSGMSSAYATERYFDWMVDDVFIETTTEPPHSTGASYTFEYLEPGTEYTLSVVISGLGNSGGIEKFATLSLDTSTDELPPPDPFDWKTSKKSGEPFELLASEWYGTPTSLTTLINEVRLYLGGSEYQFTPVGKGDTFMADMYNEAVRAIQGIPGGVYGAYLSEVKPGWDITDKRLNNLRDELNAVFHPDYVGI